MEIQNRLDDEAIGLLNALVGANFGFLGGFNLNADLVADHLVLVTDEVAVTISGDTFDGDFEGFEDEYSKLEVRAAGDPEIQMVTAAGYLFRQYSGQPIVDVKAVVETVTCFETTSELWRYSTVVSLVVFFESSFVAVTKLGHHDEVLKVTHGRLFDVTALPKTEGRFDDGKQGSYRFVRELKTLGR